MTCVFSWQHTQQCEWETFEGHETFLAKVQRKGPKLGKKMVDERKEEMWRKHLNIPMDWIVFTILNDLNLPPYDRIEELREQKEMSLAH
jgi:hypothetical protein